MDGSDIEFHHSGGVSNSNPDNDLGGTMSTQIISTSINNLLRNITPTQALDGYIDYRCFYIKNVSLSETLSSSQIWIDSQVTSGADVTLGFYLAYDVQNVIITTSDSSPIFDDASLMILEIADYGPAFTVIANIDPVVMAANFQTMLNVMEGLTVATVVASGTWPTVTFAVTFVNENRKQNLFVLVQNNLGNDALVDIIKDTDGSPINTTSPVIAVETNTPPANISFTNPLVGSPVPLGSFLPTDSFPVWVRRETASGTVALQNDGFTIGLDGSF